MAIGRECDEIPKDWLNSLVCTGDFFCVCSKEVRSFPSYPATGKSTALGLNLFTAITFL